MSFPLRTVNSDLVDIVEITNQKSSSTTDKAFEQLLCYNLIKQTSPQDLSSNIPQNNTGLKPVAGKPILNGIMINNNDELIDSELMVLKFDYSNNNAVQSQFPSNVYTYAFKSGYSDTIYLNSNTSESYTNSCITIDISDNKEIQKTTDDSWGVVFDRSVDLDFAAANSHLTNNGNYLMKLEQLSNPNYIFNDGSYISSFDSQNNPVYATFDNSLNTLIKNNLLATIDNTHQFVNTDFNAYKIVQNAFDISLNVSIQPDDLTQLPICDQFGNDIATPTANDFANLFATYAPQVPVALRYDVEITIEGGSINSLQNDYLNFDGNNLQNNFKLIQTGIISDSSSMYIDISNGSIYLSTTDICSNINDIKLSTESEYLPLNTQDINGSITIQVEPTTNRAQKISTTSNDLSNSTVNVFYNCNEALNYNSAGASILDESMLINPNVTIETKVLIPTTDVDSIFNYYSDSSLNIISDGDTILVSSDNLVRHSNYDNIKFTSDISLAYSDTDIIFITVANKSILSENEQIRIYDTDINVNDSISNVISNNIDLSYLLQDSYTIELNTKKIAAINTAAAPTNGWTISAINNSDIYLQSDPDKTSILSDDCLFMRTATDTSFNYTLRVTPQSQNLRSIKYNVDIEFNDIYQGQNGDIQYIASSITLEENDLSFNKISTTYSPTNYDSINNNFIFRRDTTLRV